MRAERLSSWRADFPAMLAAARVRILERRLLHAEVVPLRLRQRLPKQRTVQRLPRQQRL